MHARTQEMQEILEFLNKDWKAEMASFRKEHKEEHTCQVGNGVKVPMPLNTAVGLLADRTETMGAEIKEIKSYTMVLKEGKTVKDICKRHKILLFFIFTVGIPTLIKFWMG